jgi:superfamily II DNA/RNA helicase
MTFKELGLNHQILEAIGYMGFETATPIQELAIPQILQGNDIIACAQTGTGKSAAFILPVLNKIIESKSTGINTLIIVPTRELAVQIDTQIQGFAYFLPIKSLPVYGGGDGSDWDTQKSALKQHVNIIVATPGKLISHLNLGYVDMKNLKHLILDEADRMLDMGFYEDIKKIISYLPKERQTLMFSATMPPKIRELARQTLVNPFEISLAVSKPAEGVKQIAYLLHNEQKRMKIRDIIQEKKDCSMLIFCSTKREVSEIVRVLKRKTESVEGISSDLDQKEREEVLQRFVTKKTKVLVATDVLSRGIDIKDIDVVLNYDVPADAEDYVHRIGRTARAASTGEAITFINADDMYKFARIEKLIEAEIPKEAVVDEKGNTLVWEVKTFKKSGFKNNKSRPFKRPASGKQQ